MLSQQLLGSRDRLQAAPLRRLKNVIVIIHKLRRYANQRNNKGDSSSFVDGLKVRPETSVMSGVNHFFALPSSKQSDPAELIEATIQS